VNLEKQHQKLMKVNVKAWECTSREEAQKILRKEAKIRKKLES